MRHRRMVAPIKTIKHYVHIGNTTIATNVISNIDIVDTVVAPATSKAEAFAEGSILKAMYLEMWLIVEGVSGDHTQFNIVVEKLPSDAPAMTSSQIVNLGAYPNKKNILNTTTGVLPASVDGSPAVPIYRQWVLIPKGKQRMGLGDKMVMNIYTLGNTLRRCGFFTYKEWT